MKTRATTWLARFFFVVIVTLTALAVFLQSLNGFGERLWGDDGTLGYALAFLWFGMVGAVLAAQRPRNPIGWIFCSVGLFNVLWAFALQYAIYTVKTNPGALPGETLFLVLANGWIGTPGWSLLLVFVPLLFPNGRLLSPRWRIVAWCIGIWCLADTVASAILPGPVREEGLLSTIPNPLGIEAAGSVVRTVYTLLEALILPYILIAFASLLLRFRRARTEERQQLKWIVYAVSLFPVLFVVGQGTILLEVPGREWIINPLAGLTVLALPTAVGLAVLKYRLYDIDIIIRRTLIYSVLTFTLGLIYLGCILVSRALIAPLTGSSELAIVVSTLAIAALFFPLRRRIQNAIDRRFYRRKYNAQQVLAQFALTARDETDLARLTDELLRVVDDTMQPEFVGLWLRDTKTEKGRLETGG